MFWGSGLRFEGEGEGEGRKDLQVEFLRRHLGGGGWSVDRGSVLIGDCGEKRKNYRATPVGKGVLVTRLQTPSAGSKKSLKARLSM